MKIAVIGGNALKAREFVRLLLKKEWSSDKIVVIDTKLHAGKVLSLEKQRIYIKDYKDELIKDVDLFCFFDVMNFAAVFASLQKKEANIITFNRDFSYPLVAPSYYEFKSPLALPSSVSLAIYLSLLPFTKKIKEITFTALMSVSDLGEEATRELENQIVDYANLKMMSANLIPNTVKPYPLAFNVIPQTSDFNNETMQSRDEYLQTFELKQLFHNLDLQVNATCLRVPLLRTDSISLLVEFEEDIDIFEYIDKISNDPLLEFLDDPLNSLYPMPLTSEGNELIQIGRLRMVKENAIMMFICGDNLVATSANVLAKIIKDKNSDEIR